MANLSVAGYTVYGSIVLETEGGRRLYLKIPHCAETIAAANDYLKAIGEAPIKQLKYGERNK